MNDQVSARAFLDVDLARLVANYRILTDRLAREGTEPISVVKADAYGHGAIRVADALYRVGARRFAVADVREGLAIREALPPCEILVLGYTPPENVLPAAEAGLALTVSEEEYAKTISHLLGDRRLAIHIKLNSGMNRTGFRLVPSCLAATVESIKRVAELPGLEIQGVYSHLATADMPGAEETDRAIESFFEGLRALRREGIAPPAHISASAAILSRGTLSLPFARLGIALYGYDPLMQDTELLPVARLRVPIAQIYPIERGEAVGYGATYHAEEGEVVGVLPIGYADGLLRAASPGGMVWVGEHRVPFIGRISMDGATVSLRGVPREECREAILFGKTPEDLPALAGAAGTIPHEILAGLGKRIDRKYSYGSDVGDHRPE